MSGWIILRTSGGQTLPLMHSLRGAGFDVWTPAKVFRKTIAAKTLLGTREIEVEAPILTTFVFARESDADDLQNLALQSLSPHPAFSMFRYVDRHGGRRIPVIGEQSIEGLRTEEATEAAAIKAIRDAETYAEAEELRIAGIRSSTARRKAEQARERDRRNALRAQRCTVEVGEPVQLVGVEAFVGVTGIFEEVDGPYARVRFGAYSWKIEGWRVFPAPTNEDQAA